MSILHNPTPDVQQNPVTPLSLAPLTRSIRRPRSWPSTVGSLALGLLLGTAPAWAESPAPVPPPAPVEASTPAPAPDGLALLQANQLLQLTQQVQSIVTQQQMLAVLLRIETHLASMIRQEAQRALSQAPAAGESQD